MKLRFTKMQGAGNDFVVLDATRAPITLSPAQVRHLGDRRFGIGCDQILLVEAPREPGTDFHSASLMPTAARSSSAATARAASSSSCMRGG